MAQGKIPKYSDKRWSPRIGQTFAMVDWTNIFEGQRREYVHDERLPFVFRTKNQVKLIQNYLNALLKMRSKYNAPELWADYVLITWEAFVNKTWFGETLFDWYLYESGFILNKKVWSEELTEYIEAIGNYLRVVEDLYIDDYWKATRQKTL